MQKHFYTLYQAADILGIGYSTLRLYITQGRIPYVLVGKRKRITHKIIMDLKEAEVRINGNKPQRNKN